VASVGNKAGWIGKRVVILGLARQGKALAQYLAQQGASVVVSDIKAEQELVEARQALAGLGVRFALGGHPKELIDDADLLCLSGGVPADVPMALRARELGIRVANDAQLFLEACPAKVMGITGSAGKTTTTVLVGLMAEAQLEDKEGRAWVGGNIGNPLIVELPQIGSHDLVVMELSSFQLEIMTAAPQIASVLNVTPNHLDRHKTLEAYTDIKARILELQSPENVAVLGRDDEGAWGLRSRVRGRMLSFGKQAPLEGEGTYLAQGKIMLRLNGRENEVCEQQDIKLRGEHNLLNVLAACAIASSASIDPQAIRAGLRRFRGIPHRLEFVRSVRGADWYNDSIATAPERAIAALRSFEEPIVLLAGGRDKDLPWDDFVEIVSQRVDHLILFGEAAPKIEQAMKAVAGRERPRSTQVCAGLEAAVQAAARVAKAGSVVLLAPGGTSFDEFEDFAARGERFREWVAAL
jgi:UDP-N-acetylmuramoylalanine--D-glutamate ligase